MAQAIGAGYRQRFLNTPPALSWGGGDGRRTRPQSKAKPGGQRGNVQRAWIAAVGVSLGVAARADAPASTLESMGTNRPMARGRRA